MVANESDGNNDVDQIDDMVANIGRGYDLEFEDPLPEVQSFYKAPCCLRKKRTMHRCDRIAGYDPSYGIQIKVQILESVLQ
jgi:hypothetical protein